MSRAQSRGTHPDFPVLNRVAFDGTAAFLEADAVLSYLRTIAGRGAALQAKLRASDPSPALAAELAEEAHTLAGSASMFGLERVAQAARLFEAATQSSAPDMTVLAADLDVAISNTNQVIESLAPSDGVERPR